MEKIFIKPLKRPYSLWIYRNEIDSPFEHLNSGIIVKVYERNSNRLIGTGYINPKSVISIRLLSFKDEKIDETFFKNNILKSLKYREEFLKLKDTYRLVFSESDFLPGLIIDRYEKCLVIQILTAGMERFRDSIIKILDDIFKPEMIILKNDTPSRLKEGLPVEKKIIKGEEKSLPLLIQEDDAKFMIDPLHGQKTGFFLDQRENRLFLKELIINGFGLDLFSYVGSWSIHLAKKGNKLIGVDNSDKAIEIAMENVRINNVSENCKFIKADVFDFLKWDIKKGRKYDFIIVDPPAFVKSKTEKKDGIQGYLTLNSLVLKLLRKGGILATSSCSQHISQEEFQDIIKEAFMKNRKKGILIYKGTQSKDHPILLHMPETAYLKCFVLRVFD